MGALDRPDAIELVGEVMKQNGWTPPATDPGGTPQEITDLVEAVHCHARALVLLAGEVARRGVKSTTANLRVLMAELERKHPGDRENSLYASVELSLRRLSPESRQHIKVLGVCHGGIHLPILAMLTGLEIDAARRLAIELIEVGLGEDMGYAHLRLDPCLAPYLLGELTGDETAAIRAKWAKAMAKLTGYLYEERSKDTHLAAQLTLLELPNLLAMLEWVSASNGSPELMVTLAHTVESLFAELGRPHALAVATRAREQAGRKLGDWSNARFLAESANIDRLLERGDVPAAHEAAQQLLARCRAAGEATDPEAAYNLAVAHFYMGRVLKDAGAAEAALEPLAEAQRRFQRLPDARDADVERMAAGAIVETGDCLRDLGRLDDAAAAYEKAITRFVAFDDRRWEAVAKGQLGTVRMLQKRYAEALKAHAEARDTFEALGEPRNVGGAWHQIGLVHQVAGQLELAEQAYRRGLGIFVRENDIPHQGLSLGQLGNLYSEMGRLEEAVTFHRQACEIDVRLRDPASEGRDRSNLAGTLVKLRRYDEARQELQRATECSKSYGHAAGPWKTWAILENLELTTSHVEAAAEARQQAIQSYLAYRRAGGVSQSPLAQVFDLVSQAIQQNAPVEARQLLSQLASSPDLAPVGKALISRLQSMLAGERDPTLAGAPELYYRDAAELQLLLEKLPPG